jgi:fructose-1,6-bisphosphatase/inositol monophosphatase family enzyme
MRSGLRFRPELLRTLETVEQTDRLVSATAMAVASAVIEATDIALRENEGAGDRQAAEGPASVTGGSSIKEKSVGDYVTALDLSLDRHLSRALTAIRAMPIISEEGPAIPDLHALPEAWLIDPLDGTTASLCGETALCGPMVACLEHGEPRMSVMLSLDGTTLGIAERGRGAVVLRSSEDGAHWLPAGDFASMGTLKEGCLLFNPQSDSGRSHPAFVQLHDAMRTGAHTMAIESRIPHSMACLALGTKRRLAVIHDNSAAFPKQMAWDVLPVKLWVEERGGVYWGIDGRPYDVLQPMPIIAATRADIAEQLVELAARGAWSR